MNRILLVGFSFRGSWHYARLTLLSAPYGYTIHILLQDKNLQLLLSGNENMEASGKRILLQQCANKIAHQLRHLVACSVAAMLDLDVQYVAALPKNGKI